jgi:hypothetical protein
MWKKKLVAGFSILFILCAVLLSARQRERKHLNNNDLITMKNVPILNAPLAFPGAISGFSPHCHLYRTHYDLPL